jgi:hypothetical protein
MPRKQNNTKPDISSIEKPPALQPVPKEDAATAETEDHEYALVSVLYHALQGVQASEQYINDAERAGDDELAQFFLENRDEQTLRANRAKALLSARMESEDDDDDDDDDESQTE